MDAHQHMAKDMASAEGYRIEANTCARRKFYYEALEFYNMSLAFAPPTSPIIAAVYSDRSDLYYDMKDYTRCMENILWAEAFPVPAGWEEWSEDLQHRKRACEARMRYQIPNIDDNPFTFFRLSYPANPINSSIANCIELHEDAQYGRHFITNQDLRAGDIIVVEESYFKTLNEHGVFTRCANCFKTNKMSLKPLDTDTCALALFCSQECLEYGREKYICAIDEEFAIMPRILLTALHTLGGDMLRLKEFMNDEQYRGKNILDFNFNDVNNPDWRHNLLVSFNSLKRNNQWKIIDQITKQHPILNTWYTPRDKDIAVSYMRDVANLVNNSLGFEWWELRPSFLKTYMPLRDFFPKTKRIGDGVFLLSSLFNHSCCHNADRISVDNKIIIFTRLPIKAGEQVFINYGTNIFSHDRLNRRNRMQNRFKFNCMCTACVEDWDRAKCIERFDLEFKMPPVRICSIRAAKFEYRANCNYIQANQARWPCFEIQTLLDRNYYLMAAIARAEPCAFLN